MWDCHSHVWFGPYWAVSGDISDSFQLGLPELWYYKGHSLLESYCWKVAIGLRGAHIPLYIKSHNLVDKKSASYSLCSRVIQLILSRTIKTGLNSTVCPQPSDHIGQVFWHDSLLLCSARECKQLASIILQEIEKPRQLRPYCSISMYHAKLHILLTSRQRGGSAAFFWALKHTCHNASPLFLDVLMWALRVNSRGNRYSLVSNGVKHSLYAKQ